MTVPESPSPLLSDAPGRRLWWILGLVGLGVLIVLVAIYRSSKPLVVEEVEERLGERLRAQVGIGDVWPVLVGVELRDVSILGPGDFHLEAAEVRAPLDLGGLAANGGAPITEIRFHGVEVTLDPRSEETRSWIRYLLGEEESSGKRDEGDDSDGRSRVFSRVDLSAVGIEIEDLSVRLVDARGEPREVFSEGSFRIERSEGRRTEILGGAIFAGGGEFTAEGVDEGSRGELTLATTDLGTRWIAPLLPEGVSLRETGETRLAGGIDLVRRGAEEPWTGRGSLEIDAFTVASDELAEEPVTLPGLRFAVEDLEVSGRERIELRGTLEVGSGVEVELDVLYEGRFEGARYRVGARVPRSECQGLVEAVPSELLRDLERIRLDGSYAAGLALDLDMDDLDATKLELSFDDGCRFRRMPQRFRAETLHRPFTMEVPAAGEGRVLEIVTGPGSSRWVPLNGVSPYVKQAVLAHEDAKFYEHEGFAPWAIRSSLVENLKAGRFERGASTVTMQLAKNLYLSREKVLARKVQEVFITWWLEHELSKDEIFALYLNVIEYGPSLYGIGPASDHYFDARPSRLGPAEGAFLATALPAPTRYFRNYERGSLSASTKSEMRFLLEHMHRKGRIDREEMEWGLDALETFRFGRVQPRRFSFRQFFDPLIDSVRDGGENGKPGP